MSSAHPGFAAIKAKIGHSTNPHTGKAYGMAHAGAILAHATRNASKSAKKHNPHLYRVKS